MKVLFQSENLSLELTPRLCLSLLHAVPLHTLLCSFQVYPSPTLRARRDSYSCTLQINANYVSKNEKQLNGAVQHLFLVGCHFCDSQLSQNAAVEEQTWFSQLKGGSVLCSSTLLLRLFSGGNVSHNCLRRRTFFLTVGFISVCRSCYSAGKMQLFLCSVFHNLFISRLQIHQ